MVLLSDYSHWLCNCCHYFSDIFPNIVILMINYKVSISESLVGALCARLRRRWQETESRVEKQALVTRELRRSGVSRAVFLSRCAVFSTGLPVVEGQDLERGGPASAGEVERAAGDRGAAGLHSAPTRHRYADAFCRSLSFCLSVRPSASDRPRSTTLS